MIRRELLSIIARQKASKPDNPKTDDPEINTVVSNPEAASNSKQTKSEQDLFYIYGECDVNDV